jgi:hypothetical protein
VCLLKSILPDRGWLRRTNPSRILSRIMAKLNNAFPVNVHGWPVHTQTFTARPVSEFILLSKHRTNPWNSLRLSNSNPWIRWRLPRSNPWNCSRLPTSNPWMRWRLSRSNPWNRWQLSHFNPWNRWRLSLSNPWNRCWRLSYSNPLNRCWRLSYSNPWIRVISYAQPPRPFSGPLQCSKQTLLHVLSTWKIKTKMCLRDVFWAKAEKQFLICHPPTQINYCDKV